MQEADPREVLQQRGGDAATDVAGDDRVAELQAEDVGGGGARGGPGGGGGRGGGGGGAGAPRGPKQVMTYRGSLGTKGICGTRAFASVRAKARLRSSRKLMSSVMTASLGCDRSVEEWRY